MKTRIKTIHEETHNDDNNKSLGVLHNTEIDGDWQETLFFYFKNEMYIFFNTMTDLVNYVLYGDADDVKRAYLKEHIFDAFYDSAAIDGSFRDNISWE